VGVHGCTGYSVHRIGRIGSGFHVVERSEKRGKEEHKEKRKKKKKKEEERGK
jgi:hypothetical protein